MFINEGKTMKNKDIIYSFFNGRESVLATMHQKEVVMVPILEEALGITVKVPINLNTDCFGTFTRDIERKGDQLEAARSKAEQGMLLTGETLAISSEGIFGPHPHFPFVPYNREVVVLIDKKNRLEVIGESTTTETNFSHKKVKSYQEAYEFCQSIGFPEHGVVVSKGDVIKKEAEIFKGIVAVDRLEEVVNFLLKQPSSGDVFIETDMRAFVNPTRMRNIEKATHNLITNIYNLCPDCAYPGYELIERKKGLLCSCCGLPTPVMRAEVYRCNNCGVSQEKLLPNGTGKADPQNCNYCNP